MSDAESPIEGLRHTIRTLRGVNAQQSYIIKVLIQRLRAAGAEAALGEVIHLPESEVERILAEVNADD